MRTGHTQPALSSQPLQNGSPPLYLAGNPHQHQSPSKVTPTQKGQPHPTWEVDPASIRLFQSDSHSRGLAALHSAGYLNWHQDPSEVAPTLEDQSHTPAHSKQLQPNHGKKVHAAHRQYPWSTWLCGEGPSYQATQHIFYKRPLLQDQEM